MSKRGTVSDWVTVLKSMPQLIEISIQETGTGSARYPKGFTLMNDLRDFARRIVEGSSLQTLNVAQGVPATVGFTVRKGKQPSDALVFDEFDVRYRWFERDWSRWMTLAQ